MKKTIFSTLVVVLLISISIASSASFTRIKNLNMNVSEIIEVTSDTEDAPDWATGNFTGTWGLNVWGEDWFSLGKVQGYYGQGFLWSFKFGRLLIEYKDDSEENGTILEGLFIGPYLLGQSTDISTGNTTTFVGIGEYNETHFHWRIMGMKGPTLFMNGIFNKF